MIYTVTFNPSIDYILNVETLSSLDINRAKNEQIYAGGKGINVSVMLSRLGIKNKAFGFLAGFSGRQIEDMLKKENVKTDFIYLDSGYSRINVKIRADKELDINANGPEIKAEDINRLFEKLAVVQAGDYLVLAGSVPSALPSNIYEKILKKFSEKGVNFVVDAAGSLLKNSLKYRPFLIKPNHYELGEIFSVQIKTQKDAVKYAKLLQREGARNVLVSRGADGAVLLDENGKVYCCEAAQGKVIDTVGCGDSMVAGFLAGYTESGNYAYSLKLSSACAAATAFSDNLAEKNNVFDILSSAFFK